MRWRGGLLLLWLGLPLTLSMTEIGRGAWEAGRRQSKDQCMSHSVEEGIYMQLGNCRDGALQRAASPAFPPGYQPPSKRCEMNVPPAAEPRCDVECGPGEFLTADAGGGVCAPCRPGTFSIGQGVVLDRWSKMPPQLTAKCFSLDYDAYYNNPGGDHWVEGVNCGTWETAPDGDFLVSGDNKGLDWVESFLILHLRFFRPGEIWFTYQVDAEELADGLVFRIDNENQALDPAGYTVASQQPDRRTATFAVPEGWHAFKWIYIKDFSQTAEPDIARIFEIGYNGTDRALPECQPCRAGATSEEGSSVCGVCPGGEVFNQTAGRCTPCEDGTYALQGMVACKPKVPCTEEDYEPVFSQCDDQLRRTKSFRWREPVICDTEAGGASLPAPQEGVPCAPCPPGTLKIWEGPCEPCPLGRYSFEDNQPQCSACPSGHEAPLGHRFDFNTGWPAGLATGCVGECGGAGWRLRDGYADSGAGHEEGAESWIEFAADFEVHARTQIKVAYELQCVAGVKDRFTVRVGGGAATPLECREQAGLVQIATVPVTDVATDIGAQNIRLSVTHAAGGTPAKVRWIEPSGLTSGGASECVACKGGFYTPMAMSMRCMPCPKGKYSDGGFRCEKCPRNTFAPAEGTPECIPCGNGTKTHGKGSDACSGDCVFEEEGEGGGSFHLMPLAAGGVLGPITFDVTQEGTAVPIKHKVSFSLCSDLPTPCGKGGRTFSCSEPVRSDDGGGAGGGGGGGGGDGFSLGRVMTFSPLTGEMDDGFKQGVTVGFESGDACGHATGRTWSMQIHIQCDLSAGVGAPVATHAEDCVYHFNWYSQHGCPVCRPDSYEAMGTVCVSGYHDVSFHREGICYGGTPKPDNIKNAPCHDQLQDVMPFWAIAMVVAGCGFVAVSIASLAYQFLKYRRLYSMYQKVDLPGGGGRAMDTFELADDD